MLMRRQHPMAADYGTDPWTRVGATFESCRGGRGCCLLRVLGLPGELPAAILPAGAFRACLDRRLVLIAGERADGIQRFEPHQRHELDLFFAGPAEDVESAIAVLSQFVAEARE